MGGKLFIWKNPTSSSKIISRNIFNIKDQSLKDYIKNRLFKNR